jgi:Bifunctional DNA primase/polymerase, N-terminal
MKAHNPNAAPEVPAAEICRLHSVGFSLLPLGGGPDGKSPLCGFKGIDRLQPRRILGPMYGKGSKSYGVRLGGFAVIDCDVDDPKLVTQMEARFGVSPVHVATPRGVHLYFQHRNGNLPNLRAEGLPVDIKRGATSYVVGAHSIRPDGGVYRPVKGILGELNLPELLLPGKEFCATTTPTCATVPEGNRHETLTRAAIQMVEAVDGVDELLCNLQFIRDEECQNPNTIFDDELCKIADWAWTRRLESKVYSNRNSEFRVHRLSLDALMSCPNASDAIALLVTLQALHGHIQGKAFALSHKGMLAAGRTDLSRRRFLAARRTLEQEGLLRVARKHQAGKSARIYMLGRVRPQLLDERNIISLQLAAEKKGSSSYIC